MKLTQQQQQVLCKIKEFMESDASVFILCGYAGTGKTTMVKQIADYISQTREVALMAPTGRAARVLAKKTGYVATTIHKAIYSSAGIVAKKVKDVADSEFKLVFPIGMTDGRSVAIVDESSMLCSRTAEHELFQFGTDNLMDDLLTYIRPSFGGKVIFVGDPAQLPPVGESVSNALNADFFIVKGLKVMQSGLKEVIRQADDSTILKNAMQIRNLLDSDKRNRMVFEEREGDVEFLPASDLLEKYMCERKQSGKNDCVVICYSNRVASAYNDRIRQQLYGQEKPELRTGDILMVVQNNYRLDRMNGEFVPVLSVGGITKQTAPVYVQEGGQRVRKTITLEFQQVEVTDSLGVPHHCMVLLDLLYNGAASIGLDEHRALYINFCMRNPHLKQGTVEFRNAILEDEYYNCLKAKFGYAVTGHKCQGGEWAKVFVDYSGRTGLSDDCLRWAYTATTRARKTLYISNLPHITPFSKFRIEQVQACSKIHDECRILGAVESSPFHDGSAPDYLHAKCRCIIHNMEWTPYRISSVVSKPYQEIYYIQTPDSIERYDIRYKKGGIFTKSIAQTPTQHSVKIAKMLDCEKAMPLVFDYVPTDSMRGKLYSLIRSACDGLQIQMTNVVEHKEDYSVMYYFRTSDTMSYIKIYMDASGFVTYAKPMSLIGQEDKELIVLIEEITRHFDWFVATIREITTMCKSGQVADAYGLAKAACEAEPQNVWAQRGVGWVLYYMLKNDVERKERSAFYGHLEELAALDLLTMQTDALIFDNVVWKLAELIKQIPAESTDELDRIYSFLIKYTFIPSTGYSVLLKQLLGFETWNRLVEFFEWWNIDNLMPEDYQPFKMENGRKVMSLAEQAYIAYSKALLKRNDREKIENFVPKIEKLMEDYPDMMYPGYFCGKLKLAMGVERESALDIIMPFVRKKKTEFWVWQLLSEFYRGESDVQLACLLRAIHCKTQETFLGKVRMKLVSAYVQRRDYPRAKYHLDQVVRCYVQQGWHLPYELQNWMKESWVNNTQADSSDGIDYMRYTDAILARGANKSIAIVTYVDHVKKRALVVYAERKRANIPLSNLGVKVKEGTLLELQWTAGTDGSIVVAGSRIVDRQSLKGVSYIQVVEGKISKRENNAFAFIKKGNLQCYIRAEIIQNQHVNDNDDAVVIAVLDYNKKKDSWNWNCVTLQKLKR